MKRLKKIIRQRNKRRYNDEIAPKLFSGISVLSNKIYLKFRLPTARPIMVVNNHTAVMRSSYPCPRAITSPSDQ